MTKTSKRHKIIRKHVDKKLLFRIRIFVLVFLAMAGILSYDILQGTVGLLLALAGLLVGVSIGFIAGRIFDIKWHEDSRKVVARMDRLGVVILVFYIAFSIFRGRIFGQFIHGPTLTAFTFSIVGGVMLGRVISNLRNIRKILTIEDIID